LTLLHRASEGGHLDVAQFLIEHGADTAAQGEEGSAPLHGDLARFLQLSSMVPTRQPRAKGGRLCCIGRPQAGHPDLARFLVEHGADVAAQDKEGWTLLHWASESGHC
jgi:ankyrin repeat protein